MRLLPALLLPACILWDGTPYRENAARLTDADGDGWTVADEDCNDVDPDVHPLAEEVCDGVDNDCNGQVDEVPPETVWCLDVDGDGFGDVGRQVQGCWPEESWVRDCSDCDDANRFINPGAVELCNEVDDDCDGVVDPDGAESAPDWYVDGDGDGYGSETIASRSCVQPPGTAAGSGDCDDTSAAANPGAVEVCGDGLDNDCDGTRNACGWSGADVLDPSFAAFIAGPEAEREYLGISLGLVDANGDGVQDLAMSGVGGMYGDTTAGSLHLWYGAPTGSRRVEEAAAHVEGAPDLYLRPISGDPLIPLHDPRTDTDLLLIPTAGLSAEVAVEGAILTTSEGLYGTLRAGDLPVFARGASPEEGFGSDVIPVGAEWGLDSGLVVGAYLNSEVGVYNGAIYLVDAEAPDAVDAVAVVLGADRDGLGEDMDASRDLDGDGVRDLIGGTHYREHGGLFVLHGPLSGEYAVDEADLVLLPERGAAYVFGDPVLAIPDVNGDGYADIASPYIDVGDESHDRLDRVYFVSGRAEGSPTLDEAAVGFLHDDGVGGGLGYGLATDDIHADGVADLVVGGPAVDAPKKFGGDRNVGAVAVVPLDQDFTGGLRLWDAADAVFYGPDKEAEMGFPVATGDANNDGFPDLLISDAGWSGNGYSEAGGVWFVLGGGI